MVDSDRIEEMSQSFGVAPAIIKAIIKELLPKDNKAFFSNSESEESRDYHQAADHAHTEESNAESTVVDH